MYTTELKNVAIKMKKETLKQKAYNFILEKIINCDYSPNTMLNEEQLKKETGMSRTPIRDALSRLEQDGLVSIKSKKGILVKPLGFSEINHLFETRILIEPFALQEYGYTLDGQKVLGFYRKALSMKGSESQEENFALDDEFHSMIVNNIPNPFLKQCYAITSAQIKRSRVFTSSYKQGRLQESNREHIVILEECLKNNWEAAAEAMRKHLITSKNITLSILLENDVISLEN